jgi:putative transposase
MTAAAEATPLLGAANACRALGIPRASFYRQRNAENRPSSPRPSPPRKLDDAERQKVLDALHSPEFVDRSPAEVYHTLLDRGTYLCSLRTMYRILHENKEVRERRNQLRHPVYAKPELLAVRPNQVWSWDITKLRGPIAWTYYYLFVVMDIFSRYVTGWLLAHAENASLASKLLDETYIRQGVQPGQVTLHQDRGAPMKAITFAQKLASLGVSQSFSRPHVSDDNPFSESQFKTLKYFPGYPDRFGGFEDALAYCRVFFPWYNTEHRHSGISYLTPETVHYGLASSSIELRKTTLLAAYSAHPERFVRKPPSPAQLPDAVWINPPKPSPYTEANSIEGYTKFE